MLLDVLEHHFEPSKLLAEAIRVSRKYIVLSVPNFNSLKARLQVLFGKVPLNNKPNLFSYPIEKLSFKYIEIDIGIYTPNPK